VALTLPIVWHDDCLLHAPGSEFWLGLQLPDDELPERAALIREALVAEGATVVAATAHGDAPMTAVHDVGLVDFLREAHADWVEAGLPLDPGQGLVVPYLFPTRAMLGAVEPHRPEAVWARTGFYCFDTMTPIGEGTWAAVRGGVDATLTAVDLVQAGAPLVYAITRPPGHHVSRAAYGGSCYLNNAAIAAQALRDGGAERVAIIDIDAHHGNGAQEIFWERDDVLTVSVHVDPAAGWFPHVMGWADEVGCGTNRNLVVAPGADDAAWIAAVGEAMAQVAAFAPATARLVAASAGSALRSWRFRRAGTMLPRSAAWSSLR
jgi:acetoin utilization deacetylase AcuC-like enzyme